MLGNNGNSTVQDKYGKASWTSVVTNSSVNELRFGWFKDRLSDPGARKIITFPASRMTSKVRPSSTDARSAQCQAMSGDFRCAVATIPLYRNMGYTQTANADQSQ